MTNDTWNMDTTSVAFMAEYNFYALSANTTDLILIPSSKDACVYCSL